MPKAWKITFSLLITVLVLLGFLSFPYLDNLISTCQGSFLCGSQVGDALDYLSRSDTTSLAFGKFLYNKVVTGTIIFVTTLTFTVVAHRVYTRFINRS